jgi:type II restriction/modification system DNA methylase subunit YeeA
MDAAAFVDKWRKSRRSERSASQEHFLDLCEVLKHPKPGAVDPKGLSFTTERRVKKEGGKHGFADAWKKGFFGWEYKKKGADLNEAYNQLLQYSGDLGNPPLLVVSDMDRIEIRTRFTDYPTTNHVITLETFATPANLEKLRCLFYEPEKLRPEKTIEKITEEAAKKLAELAPSMRARFSDSTKVAHFLDRLIFCMFAEDVGLLPNQVFSQFLKKMNRDPRYVNRDITQLFEAMANGGDFYGESIPHFNGNLFDNTPPLDLIGTEFPILIEASAFDWSEMDPSIFGTLFERVMDPAQRSQLGAHYTGYRDIATLVEPVIMAPLRREWTEALEKIASLAPDVIETRHGESLFRPADESSIQEAQRLVDAFLEGLRAIRVLDPACGSGNFLYVTLRMLKDLEKEILVECRHRGLKEFELKVGPHQLFGIEINPYAFDLAQMTVWIGFIQWQKDNGFPIKHEPILQALHNFELKDAIVDLADPANPAAPDWPDSDFIVGNPPFLGGKKLRTELGDAYVDKMFSLWREHIRPEADLCCYWFEKARRQIELGKCRRAGLLATQGIRGGANRHTLNRIKSTGDVFFAVSDREWVIDGANVHISIIGFDDGSEKSKTLETIARLPGGLSEQIAIEGRNSW